MGVITYFIESGIKGPIKIGKTDSLKLRNRLRDLQTGSPNELKVLCTISGNAERKLHERFKRSRLPGGEWFKPSLDLMNFISELIQSGVAKHVGYRASGRSVVRVLVHRKILVGFDKDMLSRIDDERKLQKLDRTKFIRQAVLQWTNHLMQQRDLREFSKAASDSRKKA
jgi:hypothetical protein